MSLPTRNVKKVIRQDANGDFYTDYEIERKVMTDDDKEVFLNHFKEYNRFSEAARLARVSVSTVRRELERDPSFREVFAECELEYHDKLIAHHQNLIFDGIEKKTYDRNGNIISETKEYPIRLIELELKKVDEGYRDKREIKHDVVNHGVIVAPPELSIADWEKQFGNQPIDHLNTKVIEGEIISEG